MAVWYHKSEVFKSHNTLGGGAEEVAPKLLAQSFSRQESFIIAAPKTVFILHLITDSSPPGCQNDFPSWFNILSS